MKNNFSTRLTLIPALLCVNLFATVFVSTARAETTAGTCYGIFDSVQAPDLVRNLPPNRFQYSYESEFTFDEAGALLRDYAPLPSVIPRATWHAMSDSEKISWLKRTFSNRPEYATDAGLYLEHHVDGMPSQLIVDSTGNLEIVVDPPQATYFEWEKIVETVVSRYGVGSQQAMVSKARSEGFSISKSVAQSVRENLGWLVYTNLFDTITKLESGAERFKKDQTKLVAQSFDHPFLGPMTKIKRDSLEGYLKANARLENYDEDSKHFVRKSDASFKYTGGPSYRPDIAGPNRWSWEIRNAHRDLDDLKHKVLRDVVAHASGLAPYVAFADVPAFDSVETFERLPAELQTTLKRLFPTKADPRFSYNEKERTALETFRNFSLPYADFQILVKVLASNATDANSLILKTRRARLNYGRALATISSKLKAGTLTDQQARAQVMGHLAVWSVSSGLASAFEVKARDLKHDPRFMDDGGPVKSAANLK